jgi:predicted permease
MMKISSGYFQTMETPLLGGRDFNAHDDLNAPKVAIVNEEFVRSVLGGADPIGKTFKIDAYEGVPRFDIEIVGVVGNSKYTDLREKFEPTAFYPQAQDDKPETDISILVRSDLDRSVVNNEVKSAIASINENVDIELSSYDQMINDQLLRERLLATLSGLFAILAIILAVIGLYGLMAYMVARRSNEIGIRMALGAVPAQIVRMVLGQGMRLIFIGVVVGLGIALLLSKWVATLLYGLQSYDPACLAAASVGLAVVALIASMIPAKRAANMDPMDALRDQ